MSLMAVSSPKVTARIMARLRTSAFELLRNLSFVVSQCHPGAGRVEGVSPRLRESDAIRTGAFGGVRYHKG